MGRASRNIPHNARDGSSRPAYDHARVGKNRARHSCGVLRGLGLCAATSRFGHGSRAREAYYFRHFSTGLSSVLKQATRAVRRRWIRPMERFWRVYVLCGYLCMCDGTRVSIVAVTFFAGTNSSCL